MPAGSESHTYHTDKMKRCISDLLDKGHDEGSAHAICYTSLGPDANKIEKASADDQPCEKCDELNHSRRIVSKDDKRRYTLGVVYSPDEFDTDNEFTDAAELEKACWNFMREIQGRGEVAKAALSLLGEIKKAADNGDEVQLDISDLDEVIEKRGVNLMHAEDLEDSEIVECFIAPTDMIINGEVVKRGSWLAGIVWSPEVFEKIESGKLTGYSMGGRAHKIKGQRP